MPYIHQDDRRHYEDAINLAVNRLQQRNHIFGHLGYVIGEIKRRADGLNYNAADDPEIRAALQRTVNGD